jgi:hypothetical protein
VSSLLSLLLLQWLQGKLAKPPPLLQKDWSLHPSREIQY